MCGRLGRPYTSLPPLINDDTNLPEIKSSVYTIDGFVYWEYSQNRRADFYIYCLISADNLPQNWNKWFSWRSPYPLDYILKILTPSWRLYNPDNNSERYGRFFPGRLAHVLEIVCVPTIGRIRQNNRLCGQLKFTAARFDQVRERDDGHAGSIATLEKNVHSVQNYCQGFKVAMRRLES